MYIYDLAYIILYNITHTYNGIYKYSDIRGQITYYIGQITTQLITWSFLTEVTKIKCLGQDNK